MVFADLNFDAAQAGVESSKALATNPEYRALALAVDVADVKSVEGMVAQTVATFGRVDYSVNSAGVRNLVLSSSLPLPLPLPLVAFSLKFPYPTPTPNP